MLIANIILGWMPLIVVLTCIHIENKQVKKANNRMNNLVRQIEIENKNKISRGEK